MNIHPNIRNMQSAEKREVTQAKIKQFETWMAKDKFKEVDAENQELAKKTLQEAKALLASGSGNSGYEQLKAQSQSNRMIPGHQGWAGTAAKPLVQGKTNNANAASAEVIGARFHNPYTFIPFPSSAPERHKPTPLTIDEMEKDRLTGVLAVKVKTLSPLLSVEPRDRNDRSGLSPAMRIDGKPIVPASSIRGVIRTLTAIVSGSALDYVDDELWLCQGRDAKLDDQKLYLAEIIKPGDSFHDGIVLAGPARLVKSDESHIKDGEHPWLVKGSGRKVNSKGHQLRLDQAKEIALPKELWKAYTGRYRNAEKKELRKGDLVWLELYDQSKDLDDGRNVSSIQWARWGRHGYNFKDQLRLRLQHMLPDSVKNDGLVDITSDLFGSIAMPEEKQSASYDSFAARIRPENLVFEASTNVFKNEMPPLNTPHPGCKAFYMRNDDYDQISLNDLPRGYKVYRTSKHQKGEEPWKYANQPIFENAQPKPFDKTVDTTGGLRELIDQDSSGGLKIAFRALTKQEFALLLLVLSCDLRIGGGKPLGLGHCVVSEIEAYDETANRFLSYQPERASLPQEYSAVLPDAWKSRAELYCKTQVPVEMMRYPRAINKNQRGGMCWFGYFASPKKNTQKGLATVWTERESLLQGRAGGKDQIKAQALPVFDPQNPESDWLFGYDLNGVVKERQKNYYSDFNGNIPKTDKKSENISPNRKTRQEDRNKR